MKTIAATDCFSCLGTGLIQGFGCDGLRCPCIARCHTCGEDFAHEHGEDEKPPRECEDCEEDDLPTVPRISLGRAPEVACGVTVSLKRGNLFGVSMRGES